MLAAAQPDVVHVLTPPATHASLAIHLLEAGVHVLVEKPMALTVAEADAMVAAAARSGKYLTVDHNRWFDPVMQQARALLASGALGALAGVDVFQGAAVGEADLPAGQHGHWKASLPGGILYDLAPHPAYLLRGFVGTIGDVHVVTRSGEDGKLREVRAVVDGARALGTLTISLESKPFMNRVTLYGTANDRRGEPQQHDADRAAHAPSAQAHRQGATEHRRGGAVAAGHGAATASSSFAADSATILAWAFTSARCTRRWRTERHRR